MRDAHLTLALDRSERRFDADGRLHVAVCNLSKANVCGYFGYEIPDNEALGLDANRLYQLYRHPDELRAATQTANNLPLMDDHIIVSAEEPAKDSVAGSTGTDAAFVAPYLQNSLVVWDQSSIDRIQSGEQKEISMAYRYVADMTPGTYEGLIYDGVMRNIVFNHAALVKAGRAGPDVMVSDSFPKGAPMLTSPKAIMVRGALTAIARPLMAADAKVDFNAVLEGVNGKNFGEKRAEISTRLVKALKGKLTDPNADLAVFDAALDAMEGEECGEDEEEEKAEDEDPDDKAEDEDPDDKAEDEDPEPAKDSKPTKKPRKKVAAMDAHAVDALVKTKTAEAVREALAQRDAIDDARALVRPHLGELRGAFDSAAAVLKLALDHAGVDVKGVHPSAYAALVKMIPVGDPAAELARDSRSSGKAIEMFPGLSRIGRAA